MGLIKKIGLLFSFLSLLVLGANLSMAFIAGDTSIQRQEAIMYSVAYLFLSIISVFNSSMIAKGCQIAVPFLAGWLAFGFPEYYLYGSVLFSLAAILLFSYGFFRAEAVIKIIITTVVIGILIAIAVPVQFPASAIMALVYTVCIGSFLGFLYIVHSDTIQKETELISRVNKASDLLEEGLLVLRNLRKGGDDGCK